MTAAPTVASPPRPQRGGESLLHENARLADRVRELEIALEVTGRANRDLRRELDHARAEIRRLRCEAQESDVASELARLERKARVELMLTDTHSRNP